MRGGNHLTAAKTRTPEAQATAQDGKQQTQRSIQDTLARDRKLQQGPQTMWMRGMRDQVHSAAQQGRAL